MSKQICCKMCKELRVFNTMNGLSLHIRQKHFISAKEYYDRYLKKPDEGICNICGKPTLYYRFSTGYLKHCSEKCAQNDKIVRNNIKQAVLNHYGVEYCSQAEEVKQKIKDTMQIRYGVDNAAKANEIKIKIKDTLATKLNDFCESNDYIDIPSLVKQYGKGWLNCLRKDIVIEYNNRLFIKKEDLVKIELYNKCHGSYTEYCMYNFLTDNNIEFIHCDRQQIKPYELDFYLPKYKIGIECNGYWHMKECFLYNDDADRDLLKQKLCTNKGIKLIVVTEENIYEIMRTFKL